MIAQVEGSCLILTHQRNSKTVHYLHFKLVIGEHILCHLLEVREDVFTSPWEFTRVPVKELSSAHGSLSKFS
jgi:hypothetical protein